VIAERQLIIKNIFLQSVLQWQALFVCLLATGFALGMPTEQEVDGIIAMADENVRANMGGAAAEKYSKARPYNNFEGIMMYPKFTKE
jgi:hypothetical protein